MSTGEVDVSTLAGSVTGPNGIHEALSVAAGRIGAIAKSEENTQQHFKFRSIDAILAAAKPVFADLGISVTPWMTNVEYETVTSAKGGKGYRCMVIVRYTFTHKDGSSVVTVVPGEAVDYGDKSTTKALQMAFKYVLTQVLMIGSDEADNDGETVEMVSDEDQLLLRTNALKAEVFAATGNDKDEAQLAWATIEDTWGDPALAADEVRTWIGETFPPEETA